MPVSPMRYGKETSLLFPEFLLRKVAAHSKLTFAEFQELPGPEQSRLFAFYHLSMIEHRLLQGGLHGG